MDLEQKIEELLADQESVEVDIAEGQFNDQIEACIKDLGYEQFDPYTKGGGDLWYDFTNVFLIKYFTKAFIEYIKEEYGVNSDDEIVEIAKDILGFYKDEDEAYTVDYDEIKKIIDFAIENGYCADAAEEVVMNGETTDKVVKDKWPEEYEDWSSEKSEDFEEEPEDFEEE